jgi:hypothetical protein
LRVGRFTAFEISNLSKRKFDLRVFLGTDVHGNGNRCVLGIGFVGDWHLIRRLHFAKKTNGCNIFLASHPTACKLIVWLLALVTWQ